MKDLALLITCAQLFTFLCISITIRIVDNNPMECWGEKEWKMVLSFSLFFPLGLAVSIVALLDHFWPTLIEERIWPALIKERKLFKSRESEK